MNYGPLKIFAGSAALPFGHACAEAAGTSLGRLKLRRFSDGETFVEIVDNIRGRDVFLIQSTCTPVNEHLMELLIMMDAVRRASAARISVVIPYFGYARQDRKVQPRTPISSKLVADLITTAGADRVLTMDLHAGQIQGFFNIPVDHLYAQPALLPALRTFCNPSETVLISPDAGGVERARSYAKKLGCDLGVIDKRREQANQIAEMNIIGEVKGKVAVIIDDIIDTAGTLTQAASALKEHGAVSVLAAASHAILSGPAIERLDASVLERVIVTDTIPLNEGGQKLDKIEVVSVAGIMGEAIRRIHTSDSVTSLFL